MSPFCLSVCLRWIRLILPRTTPRACGGFVSVFGLLLLAITLPVRLQAQAPAPSIAPPAIQTTPVRPAAVLADTLNPLEQIENALTGIVKQARGCVVTIEGFGSYNRHAQFTFSTLPTRPSASGARRTGRTSSQAEKDTQESAEAQRDLNTSLRFTFDSVPVSGSGFLLGNGLVVTTAEVAAGTKSPAIIFADGRRVVPVWVNSDTASNVAVYKLSDVEQDKGLTWGDAARVFPGSFAVTLGNQGGFGNSVALGLVSATDTAGTAGMRRYRRLIQFQGIVGDGGSGGPLLNARGQVIGMIVGAPAFAMPRVTLAEPDSEGKQNAQSANNGVSVSTEDETPASKPNAKQNPPRSGSVRPHRRQTDPASSGDVVFSTFGEPMPHTLLFGGFSNVGFALPLGELQPIVARLLAHGGVALPHQGWLGIKPFPAENSVSAEGVLIQGIYIGGPADAAGLEPGDVILTVNGENVRAWHEMRRFVPFLTEGSAVQVKIRRGQTLLHKTLSIQARPAEKAIEQMKVREKQQVGDADELSDSPRCAEADIEDDCDETEQERNGERNFCWQRAV